MKLSILALVVLAAGPAFAQGGVPWGGQDVAQQGADDAECRQWAMNQVGPPPPVPVQSPASGAARGAARGAAGGAVIGSVVGRTRRGAAVGTAVGAVSGHSSAQNANVAAQQWQASATNAQFGSAYAACMEGRGYTVR
jgi:hypothetical protein